MTVTIDRGMDATGTSSVLEVVPSGAASIGVQVAGTFVATISFEATIDGTNWVAIGVAPLSDLRAGALVTSATAVGAWQTPVQVSGLRGFRARCSAYTSGTANVRIIAGG